MSVPTRAWHPGTLASLCVLPALLVVPFSLWGSVTPQLYLSQSCGVSLGSATVTVCILTCPGVTPPLIPARYFPEGGDWEWPRVGWEVQGHTGF